MKTNENKKGISLIVLIITILVMIILAAAIILNLDDTKIINKAEKAVADNNIAIAKEVRVAARAEWRVNEAKLREDYSSFRAYLISELEEAGVEDVYVSDSAELFATKYVDKAGNVVKIPNGYVVSDLATEDEVAEGLVIYEGAAAVSSDDDAQTTRNQFVWIPVPDIDEFIRRYTLMSNSQSYNLSDAAEAAEFNAMKTSVENNGGFYIARYETGKTESGSAAIRKLLPAYEDTWSVAKTKSTQFSNESVVGHLIYSEEWDSALEFVALTDPSYPTDPQNVGKCWNWLNALKDGGNPEKLVGKDVGANAANRVSNIYDMAGNVMDWTNEFYTAERRILRGGSSVDHQWGAQPSASTRTEARSDVAIKYGAYGFRVALYLK